MRRSMSAAIAMGLAAYGVGALGHDRASGEQARILVIVAHPDDELVFAPALAAQARAGSDVRIVFATSGDAGPGVSEFEPGEELAAAREDEARCASKALGIAPPAFLGFGDGTLTSKPRAPDSPAKTLMLAVQGAITEAQPDLVITWGPDGGYGHGDHRMVSALTTQVLQAMPDSTRPRLHYPALINAPLPDILEAQGWALTAADLAGAGQAYEPLDVAATSIAAQCYRTQFDAATRDAFAPGFHALVWQGIVSFREAF